MRVYIAGPMTGYEHYNVRAFEHAAAQWRNAGHEAETPFDANSRVWRRHHGRDFDPRTDTCDWGDPILAEMLAEDFAVLCGAEAVALLPGWEKSKGARSELLVALNLGLPIFDAATFQQLQLKASVAVERTDETILQEAQRLVHGDRQASYGHPFQDYVRTSRLWEALLNLPEGTIGPRKAALMMALMKCSREAYHHKRDNLTDLAGYAECASMIADKEAEAA